MKSNSIVKKYEAREENGLADFLHHLTSSESELREIISFVIQNREHQRDQELARLQADTDDLLNRLRDNQSERLLECIACFKDIVGLHRQLVEQNDEQGDRGEAT